MNNCYSPAKESVPLNPNQRQIFLLLHYYLRSRSWASAGDFNVPSAPPHQSKSPDDWRI